MTQESHAERRDPAQPEGAFDLLDAAHGLLDQATGLTAGRAARTLTPGAGTPLTQTLLAITEGQGLAEHQAPGPATLQVLVGEVVLRTDETQLALEPNHWAAIPPAPHELRATTDAVVLLTVSIARAARRGRLRAPFLRLDGRFPVGKNRPPVLDDVAIDTS